MKPIPYNPFDPAVRADPYPLYARLREEAPVFPIPGLGMTAVSRYEDVLAVLKDPGSFSSRALRDLFASGATVIADDASIDGETLIGTDPPVHTRLRKIVNRAFTPSRIRALEPRIRAVTDELVTPMVVRMAAEGQVELISELAAPLPVIMIAEVLGVGPERRADFKRWSDDLLVAATGRPDAARTESIRQTDEDFFGWIDETVAERRARPQGDLISALVASEESEEVMTNEEVRLLIAILLIAGNETTTNLLGNAVLALLEHPAQLAALRRDPSRVGQAVEEALRYDSPVQLTVRRATRDVELAGGKIEEGTMVAVLLASANRDPAEFRDPDRFELARDTRGHLAFGFGTHFCVGAPLARREAAAALEALIRRLPPFTRAQQPLSYGSSLLVRGPERLHLRIQEGA